MQNRRDDEDGQRERGSSDGESEPFLSEREMEFRLKMAQERRQSLALELELARARTASPSSGHDGSGRALENDRNTEWRKYSKLLVGAFPKFPTDAEVPIWFESVEHTLEAYEVPRSCWGQIVFPLLAERIEYLSTRLTPTQHRDYEALKEVVLDELQLSPLEYQKRFFGVRKRKTETWKSFTTRLASYLNFYVASRDVSNFAELLELLVADQLKTVLSEEALRYVRLREGAGWYKASEIARLLQTFEDAHGRVDIPKGQPRDTSTKGPETTTGNRSSSGLVSHQGQRTKPKSPYPPAGQQRPTVCFECGSAGHIRPNCPRIRERLAHTAAQQEQPERLTARVALENPAVGDRLLCVALNCRGRTMKAIVDTGAEITVVRESAVPPELAQSHGSVNLRAAFGERVEAKLVALPLTLKQGQPVFSKVEEATPVLCALTDRLSVSADCLLSAEDWSALQQGRDETCELPTKKLQPSSSEELVTAVGLDGGQVDPENPVTGVSKADALHPNEEGAPEESNCSSDTVKGDAGTLREEQKSDATLSRAWKNAEEGRGGMIVIDGLLYHRDHVLGQPMTAKHVPNRIPWSPEANEAFEGLKGALCSAVELATPDSSKPFWLFTDASAIAVGACLAQMTDNGTECPIAFASHRFTPTQMRWSTIEREAFGVIWGLKKFDT
ncbi:uncharacterized protein, partial [Dermacentor albipictus]|uniref:uncharacterized protein n=1 Tax=Dermacentor albipictus TaxID=60249 RepID=UPI0038FD136A